MMPRRALIAALAIPLPLLAAAAAAPRGGLRWPLEVPGILLSSFGEYRYDHLHAGIDISTAGATGHRVLAAAGGSIYRLKVEWRGYGRAIYIRHPGGRVTVYGHLERFEDAVLGLERRVARRRAETGSRYPGDLFLDPPVAVRRGQVIGYSGETGVGLPHLHFEVRRGEAAPIDPFAAGLPRPEDRRAPHLEEIIVTAGREDVFIDGALRERVYPLRRRAAIYEPPEPIRVGGPFLLALVAHDPAGAGGRAGLRSVRAAVNGATTYELVLRSFRFEQYPQAALLYDHRHSGLGPARYAYRLARLPGNELATGVPAAAGTHPAAIDLPAGRHVVDLQAEDSAGNRSRARLCVLVGAPPAPALVGVAGAGAGTTVIRFALERDGDAVRAPPAGACPAPARRVEGSLWSEPAGGFRGFDCRLDEGACRIESAPAGGVARIREVRNGVPGPWTVAPLPPEAAASEPGDLLVEAWPAFLDVLLPLSAPGAPGLQVVTWPGAAPVAPVEYRDGLVAGAGIAYARLAAAGPLSIGRRGPAAGGTAGLLPDVRLARPGEELVYRGPGFVIVIPGGGRFYPGPLAVRADPVPGSPALPAVSEAVELLPDGEALRERGTLRFELDRGFPDPAALGIYRWDGHRGRWAYEGGDLDPGGASLSVKFRRYGRFVLLQDASPPVVTEVEPRHGAVVRRRPRITARVEEEGEGLGHDGVAFVLDGAPLEAEFDPDRGRSTVLDLPPLAPGIHHLMVVATDTAGNVSEPVEVRFTVR
jgi:hypothetical protein